MTVAGARVEAVTGRSPSWRAGLRTGDRIIAVDGRPVGDALEAAHAIAQERFRLTVDRAGIRRTLQVSRRAGEDWGARLETPAVRPCGNRCLFCFVDQMPRGLRPSLYVKDEDYRHSFLFGNYLTLTTATRRDLAAIKRLRLSPLYVSVHATDETVRLRLLGRRKAPAILPLLRELTAAGIRIHAQAVICPGINDGRVLVRTIEDLAALHPGVLSLAIVPVGLTAHRRNLPPLQRPGRVQARRTLRDVAAAQRLCRQRLGARFVFATDEWYLLARRAVPPASAYEDFPQLENGVGIARQFMDCVQQACRSLPRRVIPARRVWLVSGTASARVVRRALRPLMQVAGLKVGVVAVTNRRFGGEVTVTGLLSGSDILPALRRRVKAGEQVFLPADLLREGRNRFLDDMTVAALARSLQARVRVVRDPRRLVRSILT